MASPGFREIEHKYVVPDTFDRDAFRRTVTALSPRSTTQVTVEDTYFAVRSPEGFIFRHRYDEELQHLTVKSYTGDSENRLEVNLDLGQHAGNQREAAQAFLEVLGITWQGLIVKELEVYYFDDCEIAVYTAHAQGRTVNCVEFEALGGGSLEDSLAIIRRYEELCGFEGLEREQQALVSLLFPKVVELVLVRES